MTPPPAELRSLWPLCVISLAPARSDKLSLRMKTAFLLFRLVERTRLEKMHPVHLKPGRVTVQTNKPSISQLKGEVVEHSKDVLFLISCENSVGNRPITCILTFTKPYIHIPSYTCIVQTPHKWMCEQTNTPSPQSSAESRVIYYHNASYST